MGRQVSVGFTLYSVQGPGGKKWFPVHLPLSGQGGQAGEKLHKRNFYVNVDIDDHCGAKMAFHITFPQPGFQAQKYLKGLTWEKVGLKLLLISSQSFEDTRVG